MIFGISPPGCPCPMERTAFNAYACHQTQVDDYVNALVETDNPADYWNQRYAARKAGIDFSDLTAEDRRYIEREVSRRCL